MPEDADFYRRREQEERQFADKATAPGIREIHLEMAEAYAQLSGSSVIRPPSLSHGRSG
jgi:hypothetical protein